MITIRKLRSLKSGTLRRKTAVILQSFEAQMTVGRLPDIRYLSELSEVIIECFGDNEGIRLRAAELKTEAAATHPEQLLRRINSLRHEILKTLGTEPADWDMTLSPLNAGGGSEVGPQGRFDGVRVFLDDLRSPFNVGSVFRTAEAFGVSEIILSPDCPPVDHPRTRRSSMGCTELVSWRVEERNSVLSGCGIFALELGGKPVSEFDFPERGIAVIGSEELGISPEAREAAENSLGLVSIPVYGVKGSINVSTAFGIMMQRWAEHLSR